MIPKLTQLAVFAACVVGFVVLSVTGKETGDFLSFVTPVLAAVFLSARLESRSDRQDETLAKISHQTNGVLTKRIEDAVSGALDKRGL
ncbi:hypothetical protein [Streptomyces sp. GZWMJZ-114]|uniref:hypothetical protein n=1 Tax=Streptomyces sp. GZWMJZ-114 TaxID=2494734 RepID=UPI001013A1F3|nr:hypothetical protein [Streptomyces sp. GZWMJZ-114]